MSSLYVPTCSMWNYYGNIEKSTFMRLMQKKCYKHLGYIIINKTKKTENKNVYAIHLRMK